MNFVKFLRTPFLTEQLWWLLLSIVDVKMDLFSTAYRFSLSKRKSFVITCLFCLKVVESIFINFLKRMVIRRVNDKMAPTTHKIYAFLKLEQVIFL